MIQITIIVVALGLTAFMLYNQLVPKNRDEADNVLMEGVAGEEVLPGNELN